MVDHAVSHSTILGLLASFNCVAHSLQNVGGAKNVVADKGRLYLLVKLGDFSWIRYKMKLCRNYNLSRNYKPLKTMGNGERRLRTRLRALKNTLNSMIT